MRRAAHAPASRASATTVPSRGGSADEAASRLDFGLRRRVTPILQSEATECGLACIAMVAGHFGYRTDLATLRRRFSISLKGSTLAQLIEIASALGFVARPLRLELEELPDLRTPCVLHWDLSHFVVLTAAGDQKIEIVDPARGVVRMSPAEASRHFTGIALELSPAPDFVRREETSRVRLRDLVGRTHGFTRSLACIAALAIALEAFALVSPLFMQMVVDSAIVSADRDLLLILALGFGLLLLVQTAIGLARSWVVLYTSTHLSLQWSASVFARLLRLPVQWFERRHMGDVVSRFGAIHAIQGTLTTSFVEGVLDGLMAVAVIAVMLYYSWLLSAISVGAVVLYAGLRALAYRPLRRATEEQIVLNARASTLFMESVRGIVPIKLFCREEERQARWLNAVVDATNRVLATEKMMIGFTVSQALLAGLEHLLVVYLGALLVIDGKFSVGMLFAFVAYRTTFSGRMASLINKVMELRMLRLQAERLGDIVLSEPEDTLDGRRTLEWQEPPDLALELRNVSFRYGDHEPWVLRNVSLRIEPGESVAITGPSGSGKTTLLKVLLGILPPTEGEVRLGQAPLRQFGVRDYRRLVGCVMQDDQLLAGSIAENISFFDLNADQERVETCARVASVHQDIAAMPMGYATLVGDMGTAISGGQKQRILLARALYKTPRILFLDEATSHLDGAREHLVVEAVRRLALTRVTVAHRPQTLASADRVVVLGGGAIVSDSSVTASVAAPMSPAGAASPG